jgi:hypothetical protein
VLETHLGRGIGASKITSFSSKIDRTGGFFKIVLQSIIIFFPEKDDRKRVREGKKELVSGKIWLGLPKEERNITLASKRERDSLTSIYKR